MSAAPPERAATPAMDAGRVSRPPGPGGRWTWPDTALLLALALLAVVFLAVSWRKWPDPVVDFGRELYLPWRLSLGAVLYRDLQHAFGPLSQYVNGLLFVIAGVGFSTIVAANLAIYAVILTLLYRLAREGWGRLSASVACAIFVAVFSFSHLVGIGNYNYAAPYAHEVTHGMALTLLLILTWVSVFERFARWKCAAAGLLSGLCVLLKPEFILAAGAVTAGSLLLLSLERRSERGIPHVATAALCVVVGVVLPPVMAAALFRIADGIPLSRALQYANNAWITVFRFREIATGPAQHAFLGTDDLLGNLRREFVWGGLAVVVAGVIGEGCRRASRFGNRTLYAFAAIVAAVGVWVFPLITWRSIGTALPGLLVLAAVLEGSQLVRAEPGARITASIAARVLLWLAASALLLRMGLNPRVYHYGFYQAPLAATVGIATLLSAVPECLSLTGAARACYKALLTAFVLASAAPIALQSAQILSLRDQPIGTGPDRFYVFGPRVDPTGAMLELTRQYLAADRSVRTLLVLPEGVMLNYLTRLPSSIPDYNFQPPLLTAESRAVMLKRLRANPPDRVAIVSRDLTEFGVRRFGDSPEHGQELLEFVKDRYTPIHQIGGDPLDTRERGIIVGALRPVAGEATEPVRH